jgi:hypothetical protein
MQRNLEEQKCAIGSRTACPRLPRAQINSLVPPARSFSHLRKLKVAKGNSRLGKVQKMHAGLKVKPRFNILALAHRPLVLLSVSGHPAANIEEPASKSDAAAQYNEIPSARFALFIDLSRYSTINGACSRNSENAAPIAQGIERAPASSFPPLPLRAPVGNPPVGLNPQASSHLKQGYASPGKATQAPTGKSSASLACKASFLCPRTPPRPLARKVPALLRFVARNCALSLIIALCPGIRVSIPLSREVGGSIKILNSKIRSHF